jgi:hypothetical protein
MLFRSEDGEFLRFQEVLGCLTFSDVKGWNFWFVFGEVATGISGLFCRAFFFAAERWLASSGSQGTPAARWSFRLSAAIRRVSLAVGSPRR